VDIIKRYLHTLKIEKIGKQKLEFINVQDYDQSFTPILLAQKPLFVNLFI